MLIPYSMLNTRNKIPKILLLLLSILVIGDIDLTCGSWTPSKLQNGGIHPH